MNRRKRNILLRRLDARDCTRENDAAVRAIPRNRPPGLDARNSQPLGSSHRSERMEVQEFFIAGAGI